MQPPPRRDIASVGGIGENIDMRISPHVRHEKLLLLGFIVESEKYDNSRNNQEQYKNDSWTNFK